MKNYPTNKIIGKKAAQLKMLFVYFENNGLTFSPNERILITGEAVNVITLGHTKSDNIHRMMTTTDDF